MVWKLNNKLRFPEHASNRLKLSQEKDAGEAMSVEFYGLLNLDFVEMAVETCFI